MSPTAAASRARADCPFPAMHRAFASWCAFVVAALFAAHAQQPNIIFFLVDDMGWEDSSVPFWRADDGSPRPVFLNARYRTPNMLRLADQGMMFTRAYAAPVCSPSRCSIISGMNAARHRVTNWTLQRDKETDEPNYPMLPPRDWCVNGIQPQGTAPQGESRHPLTEEPFSYRMQRPYAVCTPLPELLRQRGYVTIHCGKAHWGAKDTPGANPTLFGFDYNIAGSEIGGLADYRGKTGYGPGPFTVRGMDKPEYRDNDVFLTEALTREAIATLQQATADPRHAGKPFFLYMAHYAVHCPLDERAHDARFPYEDPHDGHPWSEAERNYAALIEGMDKSLGDLMQWLQERGLRENTVLIFMSDNGGLARAEGGRLGDTLSNFPLRGGKGTCYEGGIRVPLIVCWPGTTRPRSICTASVVCEDLFPTILQMAGYTQLPPTVQSVDGVSLVPQLRGEPAPASPRPILFHFPHNWVPHAPGNIYSPQSALVCGDFKLIHFAETNRYELYNLKDDISERHDLSQEQPAKLQEMINLLNATLKDKAALHPRRR